MFRRSLTALAVLVLAGTALAQEPARFLIERIEVRNAQRVKPQLILSESLLREGQEYSEAELSAAAGRLSRLPFLLSVDFALEKGSDRGRFVLVIHVTETKPFFFFIDARPTVIDDSRRSLDYEIDPGSESKDAALGFRWFVGGRGIVHLGTTGRRSRQGFTSGYSAWAVGYTQYDLFGTGAFATLNIRRPFDSPAEGLISPQLVVGVPVTTNQTLTLNYEDTNFRDDDIQFLGLDFHRQDKERVMSLAWTYNTTNQPFVPTRGTILRATALRSMRDRSGFLFFGPIGDPNNPDPLPTAYAQHMNGSGIDLAASRYWELSELNSVSAGALAGWASVNDELVPPLFRPRSIEWRPAYEILHAGYSRNLWRGDANRGDSRLELDARFVASQRNVQEGQEAFGATPNKEKSFQLSASWVRRSSWGTLRLGAGYAWGY